LTPAQDKITTEVLDAMRMSKPLIAASKRCCVVCTQILEVINDVVHQIGEGPYYPILWSHRHIFPCALPPGTPVEIRTPVLAYFDRILKSELDKINAELQRSRSNASNASNASAQSQALNIPSDGEGHVNRHATNLEESFAVV
jgi:hypothetical protein